MENKDILKLINAYFAILESNGKSDKKDLIAVVCIMFMSEYYEFFRNISFNDIENNEIGLTDCMVKKLNTTLDCFKKSSRLVQCVNLGEFYTKWHWIIPDDHSESDYYVANGVLYAGNDTVSDGILDILGTVENKILLL